MTEYFKEIFAYNDLILRWVSHRPRYNNVVAYLFPDAGVWNRNNICSADRRRISIPVRPSRHVQNTMKKHLDMPEIHGILGHDQANIHTF